MIFSKQGKSGVGMTLTPQQVCDAEFVASWMKRPLRLQKVRSSPGRESGGVPAGSPLVTQGRGTRNKLVWLQLRFELEDMAVKS